MRYFLNHLGRMLVVLGLILTGSAQAQQFVSLHQFPVVYNISSSLDASGNLNYTRTPQLFGFKDQFAPTGVPGCVIGYPEWRSACQKVNGGFSFVFENEYTDYYEYRVFVPAGTTFFALRGFLSQTVQYAAAVRLGAPPSRTAMLSPEEYQNAKLNQNEERDFARLLAGEERILVHDGSGVMKLSGTARLSTNPMAAGQWLYIRALNSSPIFSLGAVYEVNLDLYKAGYNATQFGADGDPVSSGGSTPPVNPPGGGTTLTGITLTKSEWTVGTSGANFIIKPSPESATLPSCTFSPDGVLAYTALIPPSATMASVSINTTAAQQLAQAHTVYTINCGGKTATFTIHQAGTTTTATVEEVVESNGTMTLKLKITRPAAEVVAGAKASYWVGAVIPGSALFSQEDEWFYLSTGSTATTYDWKQLILPNPISVAFAKDLSVTAATEELRIPLGFTKAEFAAFQIKVHFGYQMNGGTFKKLDYVWNPAP